MGARIRSSLLCVVLASLAVGAAAGRGTVPPPQMTRLHTFGIDLDRDGTRERIRVYNVDRWPGPLPTTYLAVDDRRAGSLVQTQLTRVYGPSPGAAESGLAGAWAGDLNRDGRTEVAVRDLVTPSVGEVLSLYRQAGPASLLLVPVQTIPGDRVVVGRAGEISATLRANHSPDGRTHVEIWRWHAASRRWACTTDCVPRG
jgi:hypothetical protein